MYACMCDWVTLLYSTKLTEHCKPAILEKIKIIINIEKEEKKIRKENQKDWLIIELAREELGTNGSSYLRKHFLSARANERKN